MSAATATSEIKFELRGRPKNGETKEEAVARRKAEQLKAWRKLQSGV